MEKKLLASPEKEILGSLVKTIHESQSGKTLIEAIGVLSSLIVTQASYRECLLNSRDMLSNLVASCFLRANKKMAISTEKRFKPADDALLVTLGEWEELFRDVSPLFASWLSVQRARGLKIPELLRQKADLDEAKELRLSQMNAEYLRVESESRIFLKELGELAEAFTPSLEEAFESTTDVQPARNMRMVEQVGLNDDLFDNARGVFNYLSKKLIPRLSQIAREAKGTSLGNKADSLIACIQSSPQYVNFVMVLSDSKAPLRKPPKRLKHNSDDSEYQDWFE
jgi:hypothetical protein